MTEEIEAAEGTVMTATEEMAPAPKEKRAPRRDRIAADTATTSEPVTAKKVLKERKKRAPKTSQPAKPSTERAQVRRSGSSRPAAKTVAAVAKAAPSSAVDEMADLMHLEEENKRLRQTLAEKLRAENADLRKRLGLA